MKRLLSLILALGMIMGCVTITNAETNEKANLLSDGGFENSELPSGKWTFPDTGIWYGEGEAGLENSIVKAGEHSAMINDGVIGQRIDLEAGRTYTISADIYSTELDSSINMIIYYDGQEVKNETKTFDWVNDWKTIDMTFECAESKSYVICFYGLKTPTYVDDVTLYEMEDEPIPSQVTTETPSLLPTQSIQPDITETPSKTTEVNILTDNSFESGTLSNANSWKFTGGQDWYGYGTEGKIGISNEFVKTGNVSVKLSDGMIGQRVTLEAGKRYKFSAQIYSTEFYSAVDMGFYDGTEEWPGSNSVKLENKGFDWCDSWGEISLIFDCKETKEYIVGFFENSTTIYIDDAVLCETDEEAISDIQVVGDYDAVSGTYDSDKLLNVSRGGYLINRNKYWMPSLYDELADDGVNMVRMDWILSDQFYHVVSKDENGDLKFDFTLLDSAILPLLEKGMTPYMCMNAIPSVLGGTGKRGENKNGMTDEQLDGYEESVRAVVQHYKDLGYTGWYWESDNEPEDQHMGNVRKICEKYGRFSKAVKAIDSTAKVGGIGFRNGDVNKDASWKNTFFDYLKENPDVPFDFVSIHVYNKTTDFSAADAYVEKLKEIVPERGGIPVIYSEWNYDWSVGEVGSVKDTNINAAYAAKRMFTALSQDNVDYVFYFTPSDAYIPGNLLGGDSGLYTIDGHRKAAANTFSFYNDMEAELITPEEELFLNKKKMTAGFVTKNSETERVTVFAFNYTDTPNDVYINIDNLPYDDSNMKVTLKEIDADSGNYCKDYLDGYRGYSITPHELPDESVEVMDGVSSYSETVEMPAYSVIEIVLEPTDDDISEMTLQEKHKANINLAYGRPVTANSIGKNGVVGYNSDMDDFDFSNVWEQTTETDSEQYLIQTWNPDRLTDGYRLSFDMVNNNTGTEFQSSNLGYRSEAYSSPDNNVWVTIELDKIHSIDQVNMYPTSNMLDDGQGFPVDFKIQVSVDGEKWSDAADISDYKKGEKVTGVQTFVFDNIDAKYVRLNATELAEADGGYRLQLAEIEVFNNSGKEPEEQPTVNPTDKPDTEEPADKEVVLNLTEEGVFVSSDKEQNAVIIKVSYGENGEIDGMEISDTDKLKIGETQISFTNQLKKDDKIMVWESLDTMKPLCESKIYSEPEIIPTENKLFDGAIEATTPITDGRWKPSVGIWKKGLGDSVELDSERVSDNSTLSARIVNAALYQAVNLEGGEKYRLSFDIYLNSGLDKSKLSWGIFNIGDNGYVSDLSCGYKDGQLSAESDFDASKKNEWQHVEIEFECSSTAKYAVEFLYANGSDKDGINIDNVSLTGGKPSAFVVEQHNISYTDSMGRNITLYGRLYRPNNNEKCGAVILSHGYNAYADAYAQKCEFFAENGYAAYAFDFCGGSTVSKSVGRETTEMTIFTEAEDLVAVFEDISSLENIDSERVFLSGDSQGGMISALAAEKLGNRVRGMALQFPAFCIPDDWRKKFRNESDIPETYNHWGLLLGKVFFTSIRDFYPYDYLGKNYTNDLLIISGDEDNTVPISTVEYAAENVYKNAELVVFHGEGHGFSAEKDAEAKNLMIEFMNNR